jgi:hypothetical protein
MKPTIVNAIPTENEKIIEKKVMNTNWFIDNKKLYDEFVQFHMVNKKYESGVINTPPRISDYMGKAFISMANKYSNHYKFRGYTNAWKEEMIEEAILTCCKYCKSFDPAKSENPFSYITYIIHTAFLNKIKEEKRAQYIRYKLFVDNDGYIAEDEDGDMIIDINEQYKDALSYVNNYENSVMYSSKNKIKNKTKTNTKKIGLDSLFD